MAVCAPAAMILMIARPVLMLAGISNHLCSDGGGPSRPASTQLSIAPRSHPHGRPIRRWGSSDRTNQPSGVPERRPARSSADRTRPLKPQGSCWPSAAQKRLLRCPSAAWRSDPLGHRPLPNGALQGALGSEPTKETYPVFNLRDTLRVYGGKASLQRIESFRSIGEKDKKKFRRPPARAGHDAVLCIQLLCYADMMNVCMYVCHVSWWW